MDTRSSKSDEVCSYRLRRIGCPATMKDVVDVFVLQRDITVIGRAKNKVDFFIDSSKNKALISRMHARISKLQTQSGQDMFKIHDVSLNGTYVNDMKISCEALLTPGDVVVFGHVQGACLESGNRYKQLNSEFKFMFECFYDDGTENSNSLTTGDGTANTLDKPTDLNFSKFLETPTAPPVSESSNYTSTRRKLKNVFEKSEANYDSEVDYNMLKDYFLNAATSFANQCDDELFSVKYTQILPVHQPTCEEKPRESESTKSPDKKRKRRRSKQSETVSKSQHTNNDDRCSASKCMNPGGKIVSWVQCDDCDKWYHIKCCGLSLRLVKVKNSKFHCGCS